MPATVRLRVSRKFSEQIGPDWFDYSGLKVVGRGLDLDHLYAHASVDMVVAIKELPPDLRLPAAVLAGVRADEIWLINMPDVDQSFDGAAVGCTIERMEANQNLRIRIFTNEPGHSTVHGRAPSLSRIYLLTRPVVTREE